jgi:hypothetical protein
VRIATYDLVLIFPAAALRIDQLRAVGLEATARLVGVDLCYRAETDLALLVLHLDARTATHTLLARIRDEAESAGAIVLEPARLDDTERERFYGPHLASYPLRVANFPTVADAVRKLANDLGCHPDTGQLDVGAPRIEVRVRRGDRWLLGRARSLTREGIYVYSGCAPRVGETLELQLATGDLAITLSVKVVHITRDDAAVTIGGSGFGARFLLSTHEERQQLEALVHSGRGEGLGTLRPAPARREVRYPVRWPVDVNSRAGASAADALDVSLRGMFVAVTPPLLAGTVEIRVPADEGAKPIRALGRIARAMSEPVAHQRGVVAGVGIEIGGFPDGDEQRFRDFVARVGLRAARHVIVGATAARLPDLVDQLTAGGYVASGLTSTADVLARVSAARPDLVLLDPSLVPSDHMARSLRRALPGHTLCHRLDPNQDDRSVRDLVDAALLG